MATRFSRRLDGLTCNVSSGYTPSATSDFIVHQDLPLACLLLLDLEFSLGFESLLDFLCFVLCDLRIKGYCW